MASTSSRVPSLAVPDDDVDVGAIGAACDAVRLFVERARRRRPDFAVDRCERAAVAQVCRRLDGVPLAIELAAARVPMMTPADLDAAVGSAVRCARVVTGERGGTAPDLRASIDWSYEMLDDGEQRLLERMGVFAGGCTRQAAVAVGVGGPVEERAVLALLRDLVARSLVS